MPAASEAATAVETTSYAAVRETATGEMGGTHAAAKATNAVSEAPEMSGPYAVVETHAVMDDCPFGADAVIEAATSEVGEPWAVVDVTDTASYSMVETVTADTG